MVREMVLIMGCAGLLALGGGCARGGDETPLLPGQLRQEQDSQTQDLEVNTQAAQIIFLHHSTGGVIYNAGLPQWFEDYNREHGTSHRLFERAFPQAAPYGWNNYPFDYWNIWVAHAGGEAYLGEPTLEMLGPLYDVVVFKHCFPVSSILPDTGAASVDASARRAENYKLQYAALREKLRAFPGTRFIVWTGAALVEKGTTPEQAERARDFFDWVKQEWDEEGDNIFVWDFYELETEGGLYLREDYAAGSTDSHPASDFARRVAPLLGQRIVDVIGGQGDSGSLTGE